ncbi:MAG: hypothetical protein KKG47_12495 [Proteobacteria bacterium]|nr:hypothetical protein [Pseudomonadota bacterium]MBU1739211.1 hypothetical protein [Pseudomonadota bacterium]
MNRKKVVLAILITLINLAVMAVPPAHCETEQYRYRESQQDKQLYFFWSLEQTDKAVIRSIEPDVSYYNECEFSGNTIKWEMNKNGEVITAYRDGNRLIVNGVFAGEKFHRTFEIDDAPWFQPLSYSLRRLLKDDKRETIKFWFIRPDVLQVVKLVAEKEPDEEIDIDGMVEATHKIRVSMNGMMKKFWSCYYWFRKRDRVFVKYEGLHGVLSSSRTVITLSDMGR